MSQLVELNKEELPDKIEVIESEPEHLSVAIESQYAWVYDEEMKIDYSDVTNTFQLKSPNQMLNPRMKFLQL